MQQRYSEHLAFSHPLVRQLAWCIGSPALISGDAIVTDQWLSTAFEDARTWLASLDEAPEPLQHALERCHSYKLGVRFETFIAFWLHQHPRFKVHATNLQVVDDGQTLGEFDFLFTDLESGETHHWETAVKFYLSWPQQRPTEWMGPGGRDTLRRKERHALNKQLALSKTNAGAIALQRLGLETVRPKLFIKGMLFEASPAIPSNLGISQTLGLLRERAQWCTIDTATAKIGGQRWKWLDKTQWLGKLEQDGFNDLLTPKEWVQQHAIEVAQRPAMVAAFTQQGNCWKEVERWFVVGNAWEAAIQAPPQVPT